MPGVESRGSHDDRERASRPGWPRGTEARAARERAGWCCGCSEYAGRDAVASAALRDFSGCAWSAVLACAAVTGLPGTCLEVRTAARQSRKCAQTRGRCGYIVSLCNPVARCLAAQALRKPLPSSLSSAIAPKCDTRAAAMSKLNAIPHSMRRPAQAMLRSCGTNRQPTLPITQCSTIEAECTAQRAHAVHFACLRSTRAAKVP